MDTKKYLILLVLFSLIGCATNAQVVKPDFNLRQEYVNNHPDLGSDITQSILNGKVIKGMTKADVLAAWGEPSRISPEAYGESWFYDQPFFSLSPRRFVSFTSEGKVYNYGEIYGG